MRTKEEIEARHIKLGSLRHLRTVQSKSFATVKKSKYSWKPNEKTSELLKANDGAVYRLRYSSEHVNRFQEHLIKQPTETEALLIQKLLRLGFDFDFQKPVVRDTNLYFIDFYFPVANLAVEIDGGYHFTEKQRKNDGRRMKEIRKVLKCKFLRFTNDDVNNNWYKCVSDIAEYLRYDFEGKN